MPTQISGAKFLASRRRAFLWDQPRVGKTGAAVIAADLVLAQSILIVTTASGRGVWRKAFPTWSRMSRSIRVLGVDRAKEADVDIVSWGGLNHVDRKRRPQLIILDEDHKASSPEAQRNRDVYGLSIGDGRELLTAQAIVRPEDNVWHLSGTPMPHDLGNTWARMRVSCPERLEADTRRGWPDVVEFTAFRERYCIVKRKKLSNFTFIPVVFGGRNEAELNARLEGMYLRRTQADVGIRPPSYEMLPLIVSASQRAQVKASDEVKVLAAIDANMTREVDMELAALRRVTGVIKAGAVVEAVKEELDGGVEKLVLAYWHKNVGDILETGLSRYGVVRLDGSTSARGREQAETEFRQKKRRVFLAQIIAAGEAIDLSPANELWFVETSFSPKDMDQMSKRITNVGQTRNCFVRVCYIENSLDEPMQQALMRLWKPINNVLS